MVLKFMSARQLTTSACLLSAALSIGVARGAIAQTQPPIDEVIPSDAAQVAPTTVAVTPPAAPTPLPTPFTPRTTGIIDLAAGADKIQSIGHLRPQNVEALAADRVNWLSDITLPLYASPGGDHWGWLYQGWLIPQGQSPIAIGRDAGFAMVRAYQNLHTFPVLETREDGWFRVQYAPGGSAWAHTSQLDLGDVTLVVERWEERLRSQDSLYFLETSKAQPLRSGPESANNMLSLVPTNSLIEPLEFSGDWMRVRVTRPASTCRPLTGATTTEGWMRWRGDEQESLVWYRPGSCA